MGLNNNYDLSVLCLQLFYLPIALAVPPSVSIVHIQFNLLYQFWVHTEVGLAGKVCFIYNGLKLT